MCLLITLWLMRSLFVTRTFVQRCPAPGQTDFSFGQERCDGIKTKKLKLNSETNWLLGLGLGILFQKCWKMQEFRGRFIKMIYQPVEVLKKKKDLGWQILVVILLRDLRITM